MASVDCSGCSCSSSDKLDADPLRPEQIHQLAPILQVGAGRIAERVARSAVCLVADHLLHRPVVGGEPEIGADPGVPHLGQRLGELHAQAVQLQVVAVGVLLEQPAGHLGDTAPHGDQVERDDVRALGQGQLAVAEEVGQAQVTRPALPREGEPARSRPRVGDLAAGAQHDERVAVAVAGPVAVDHGELGDAVGLDPVQPGPKPAAGPRLSTRAPRYARRAAYANDALLSPHWPMKVARSSRYAATSASAIPLTIRSPQNGGVGTSMSIATSERARQCRRSVEPVGGLDRLGRALTRRSRGAGSAAPSSPRLTAISASISRRPSKASRA